MQTEFSDDFAGVLRVNIRLLLEREKQQKVFTFCFHCLSGVDLGKN